MLKTVVAHSDDPDSLDAVQEIVEQCKNKLSNHEFNHIPPQAGILFAAIDFDFSLILEEITLVFPDIELIGCTTDGEMSSVLGFQQDSLTLMLFCSDTVKIHSGAGHKVRENPIDAAKSAVAQATQKSSETAKLCICLPASYTAEGLTTSGESILEGLKLALNVEIPILGGTAGDQYRFQTTYQFFGNQVLTDSLPVLIFSGDILFSHGISCGWQPVGRKGIVTKSAKTLLYEVDGKSAVEFYQHYLGDRPPTAENSLAVFEGNSDRYYIRVPNTHDSEVGSINFLGNIPEQAVVQITNISREEIITASKVSFNNALKNYPGKKPAAALLFSCCCRRWALGTRAKEEYELIEKAFDGEISICGFYTYGEFAPLELSFSTYYHQETFVTLLLGTE
ncbi:MAG: FIST N-terminal domain-containing protein [Cyanobacteria bacterium P01_A01_bin.84]